MDIKKINMPLLILCRAINQLLVLLKVPGFGDRKLERITPDVAEVICKKGIIHYTTAENAKKIRKSGYIKTSADYFYFGKYAWFLPYLADNSNGCRQNYHAGWNRKILITGLTPEQLRGWRFRKSDGAIAIPKNFYFNEEQYHETSIDVPVKLVDRIFAWTQHMVVDVLGMYVIFPVFEFSVIVASFHEINKLLFL